MYHIRIVIDCMLSWKGEGFVSRMPSAKNQPIPMKRATSALKVDKCPLRRASCEAI